MALTDESQWQEPALTAKFTPGGGGRELHEAKLTCKLQKSPVKALPKGLWYTNSVRMDASGKKNI